MEGCKVEISQTSPDIREEIELGRILLDRNATRIRDARDPNDPKANEIDLRYVPRAGVIGSWLDPTLRIKLSILLERLRRMLLAMARDSKVGTAHDALAGVVSAQTLHTADLLDNRNGHEVLNMLAALQDELVRMSKSIIRSSVRRKSSATTKAARHPQGLLSERRNTPEALDNMLVYLAKAGEELAPLYAMGEAAETLAPTPAPNQAAPTPAAPADGGKAAAAAAAKPRGQYGPTEIPPDDMERIKGISSQDLPMELEINGETWIRIDMIRSWTPIRKAATTSRSTKRATRTARVRSSSTRTAMSLKMSVVPT